MRNDPRTYRRMRKPTQVKAKPVKLASRSGQVLNPVARLIAWPSRLRKL
jgi:hypothetical protein